MDTPLINGLLGRFTRLLGSVPAARVPAAGRLIGRLIACLDVPHRRIVRRNLRFANPGWSDTRIRRTAMAVYENLGITMLEICRLPDITAGEIRDSVALSGRRHLEAGLENPNGVVLISLHIGNWEIATMATAIATGRVVTSVARPLGLPWADRWITAIRTRFGNRIIRKEGALRDMNRTLRSGGILGILIDQVTKRSEGVEARFFDRRVMATPAAALLALRCRSTVIPAFCAREPDGGLTLHFRPPLSIHRSGDLRRDIAVNTQRMNDAIVEIIREYPEQWFWFHKRWKRFYPELYPEYQARRRRKRKRELKALKKAGGSVADPQAYIDNL